jgi:hypothetical protein
VPFLLVQVVLDVVALMAALERLELPLSLQEAVAELFGLQDSVTLAKLRAAVDVAALPGRDLIRLRRALDPVAEHAKAAAAEAQRVAEEQVRVRVVVDGVPWGCCSMVLGRDRLLVGGRFVCWSVCLCPGCALLLLLLLLLLLVCVERWLLLSCCCCCHHALTTFHVVPAAVGP